MSRQKFPATLERGGKPLNWTIARVPAPVSRKLGKRGQIRIKGTINGFAFRTTLFPDGNGNHILVVNKTMQKGSASRPGALARFEIEPDTESRVVEVPSALIRALSEEKTLLRYYKSLSNSTQREIARWVGSAKHEETRERRAASIAERLMQVMDAEREPPPVLQIAFARSPKAREGWNLMPPSHKRAHLFGIFHYRTHEAQTRRIEKAVAMMIEYAERGGRGKSRAPSLQD